MADSGEYTPETLARRAKMAEALIAGNRNQPVRNWVEGAGGLAENALGYYLLNKTDTDQKAGDKAQNAALIKYFGGGVTPTPLAASTGAPQVAGDPASAIAGIESGGRYAGFGGGDTPTPLAASTGAPQVAGDPASAIAGIESGGRYDALGPETKGDRAYGKYQVMGNNIPEWTKRHVGQAMTPEQFLQNQEAQDAVFKGQFGTYQDKYGPVGAAKAWFAGEKGMNNPNAKDALGTTVASYADKFGKALGFNATPSPSQSPSIPLPQGGAPSPVPLQFDQRPTFQDDAQWPAGPVGAQQRVTQALQGGASPQGAPSMSAPQISGEPAETRQKIAAMLNDPNPYVQRMGRKLAEVMIQKQLEGEKPTNEMRHHMLDTRERLAAGLKPQSFYDFMSGIKKAGAQNTVINNTVNPILKGVGDRFNTSMESAKDAIPQINGIHEARKALDEGTFTGAGADPKLFLARVGNIFGLSEDKASNTQVLRSAIGIQVLAKAKTLGSNPTNTDRDYIEKVVGGKIALEEKTIRRLLDMQEKWARDSIKRANAEGAQVLKAQPEELKTIAPLLSVLEPPSYDDYLKSNPIARPASPAATPRGVRKYDPTTGKWD